MSTSTLVSTFNIVSIIAQTQRMGLKPFCVCVTIGAMLNFNVDAIASVRVKRLLV